MNIFDLLPIVAAFLLFLCAHGLGVVRERNRKPKPVVEPEPVLHCGCNHQLAFHNGLGACQHIGWKYVYNKSGNAVRDKETGDYQKDTDPCRCQQYTGDLPVDWFSRDAMRDVTLQLPTPEIRLADGTLVQEEE